MEENPTVTDVLQWHPTFFTVLQIELEDDKDNLNKENKLYQSAMNMIIRANAQTFEEVKDVCEALLELMKDEIDAAKKDALEEGYQEGIQQGIQEGIQKGIQKGILINIRTCKNFNASKDATISNVMKEFSLSEEEATEYVEKYW